MHSANGQLALCAQDHLPTVQMNETSCRGVLRSHPSSDFELGPNGAQTRVPICDLQSAIVLPPDQIKLALVAASVYDGQDGKEKQRETKQLVLLSPAVMSIIDKVE